MAGFLSNLIGGGASSLVDAIGTAIDKATTSDEERKALDNELRKAEMQHEIEMATLGVRETEAYLKDVDSARDNQSRVQESENASALAKNVQPLLALLIVLLTFGMFGVLLFRGDLITPDRKEVFIYILGALTTIATQVVSYYFGSSKGSADKTSALAKVASGKEG
ncbi:MAG: hypothetical protein RJA44_1171 [Pseudomonadota bacterium]|jgi:hypothetical protein